MEKDRHPRGLSWRSLLGMLRYQDALRRPTAALITCVITCCGMISSSHAQLRVVNYNIAQLRGNADALQNVFIALHADDKPGFSVPVTIFAFQEVRSIDVAMLSSLVNSAAPPGVSYALGTFTTSANEDTNGGAQAIFFRSGVIVEQASAHQDIATGAGRNSDRWLLRLAGYNSPFAWMYVYGSHLKSDTGSANQTERLNGVIAIRNNADALGANLHVIFCGDMNFYHNNEPGYIQFFASGNAQAIDPLGTGPWNGSVSPPNNVNNFKHTQSPLAIAAGGLVGGGLDDRFDFQLSTNALHDGLGLSMISGTYRTLGNDGAHYGQAIDNGNNFYYPGQLARSNALAANLRLASDHIPIVVDYRIPAMMSGSMIANYGRVIMNTPFQIQVSVSNPANVQYQFGADVLNFTANATLNLSGMFARAVQPLAPPAVFAFPLNTALPGIRNGTVTLTSSSQGVQPSSQVLNTTGMVLRPANASFSASADVNDLGVNLSFEPDTGTHTFAVGVHNHGFDQLQARLDVDDVSPLTLPFGFVGGLASGIGARQATLTFSFDTTGLTPGAYVENTTIFCSDEDVPGEAASELQLSITVTIEGSQSTCAADITGDDVVNVNDLLAVINGWGMCPKPPQPCPADVAPIGGDGLVNVNDLLAVINAWGPCP